MFGTVPSFSKYRNSVKVEHAYEKLFHDIAGNEKEENRNGRKNRRAEDSLLILQQK